jgi:hypothetical protein
MLKIKMDSDGDLLYHLTQHVRSAQKIGVIFDYNAVVHYEFLPEGHFEVV